MTPRKETEPTKEHLQEAIDFMASINGLICPQDIASFLARRDEARDAELSILRSIIGDAHSKSVMRREIAQGRVEAWLKERDAALLKPWREAVEEILSEAPGFAHDTARKILAGASTPTRVEPALTSRNLGACSPSASESASPSPASSEPNPLFNPNACEVNPDE